MSNCYEKIITISPKLATLSSGQIFDDTQIHTHTHRRKGNQHTWPISSCHVTSCHTAAPRCHSQRVVVAVASVGAVEHLSRLPPLAPRPAPAPAPAPAPLLAEGGTRCAQQVVEGRVDPVAVQRPGRPRAADLEPGSPQLQPGSESRVKPGSQSRVKPGSRSRVKPGSQSSQTQITVPSQTWITVPSQTRIRVPSQTRITVPSQTRIRPGSRSRVKP